MNECPGLQTGRGGRNNSEGGGEKGRRTMDFIKDGLPHGSTESVGKREDRVGKGMNRREK